MTNKYKLILQTGPNAGTEFLLEKDELFLGRDVNNDIVVNDPEVSRRHARLTRQGEDYIYEDLGSTNGSFILGQRLASPTILKHGTMLTIGERVMISYSVESLDTYATVAAPRYSSPVNQPPAAPSPINSSSFAENRPTIMPEAPSVSQTPPVQIPPVQSYSASPASIPPVYKPAPDYPPAPANVPPAPVMAPPPPAAPYYPAQTPKKSKGLVILLIILGVILVFCVIPWVIVELTNSYCALFPGIFNAIQAGACPV
jgi:hypothetical protein